MKLLLLLFITLVGKGSTFKLCENTLPGIERLSLGVDLTKLDLNHDYSVDREDGFIRPLIRLTCDEEKQWVSPFDGKTYNVPDQVERIVALPTGTVTSKALTINSLSDAKKSMSVEAGFSVSG